MRMIFLADTLITDEELNTLKRDFGNFVRQCTGITPTFYVQREDYSNVPTEPDGDGDLKPTKAYVTALMKKVHSRYGDYGVDSVVPLVHRNNWVFKGIWGTNWSNLYYKYHVHLCRFDNKNMANSLGTLNHEWSHSLDALIFTHTGFDINTLFNQTECYVDWDSTLVHGNKHKGCANTPFKYVRWKENAEALEKIAPHLQEAYKVRKELFYEPYKKVMRWAITELRSIINKKNGVPRGT